MIQGAIVRGAIILGDRVEGAIVLLLEEDSCKLVLTLFINLVFSIYQCFLRTQVQTPYEK